jgi:hypothetical protein
MTDEASELVAIRNTLSAYNVAGDRMRLEGLAATFTDDGILKTPTATYCGRGEIIAGLSARPPDPTAPRTGPRPSLVRHHLTTSQVVLTGAATAEGRTYFIVFTDMGPDHAGHYVDRLRKVGARWLFEHRDVRVDWVADASLFPGLKAAHAARRLGQSSQ